MATADTPVVQDLDITDQQLAEFGDEYEPKALVLQQQVSLEKITDDTTYQRVCMVGLEAAANIKAIEMYLNPLKERRYAAWKRVTEVIAEKTRVFKDVKEKSGKLVAKYQYDMEQARLAAEAAERERLQKEAEAQKATEAEQLAKEGRVEEGVAVLESPVIPSAPVVAAGGAPKVRGVSSAAEKYKGVVTDFSALVKAVAEGKVPILVLQVDQSWLNKQANQMKQLLNYPGVRIERDFSTSFRTK